MQLLSYAAFIRFLLYKVFPAVLKRNLYNIFSILYTEVQNLKLDLQKFDWKQGTYMAMK